MNRTSKSHRKLIITLCIISLFSLWLLWADKALTQREFEITDEKIPSAFDGFRIVHISDLHNTLFGEGNSKLLDRIKKAEPDIIAVTGDIADSRRTDLPIAIDFLKKATAIAPVYYVTGNHEARIPDTRELIASAESLGVKVLNNEKLTLERENGSISLCGISDPAFVADYLFDEEAAVISHSLEGLRESESFSLLLSHRPEFFDIYAGEGFDLVLSGHAHGGQFRLPLIGGFIAPGQGLFPKFDSGLYEKDSTSMIVSRGLGNSIVPLRFCNRPEIILITLKEAK